MEDERIEVDSLDELFKIMSIESGYIEQYDITTEEHQKAVNNFIKCFDKLNEVQKIDAEANARAEEMEFNRNINDVKMEIEKEKNEIESRKIILEEEMECNRKAEAKFKSRFDWIRLGFDVVAVTGSFILGMKTLNVNLESVITDRDAVSHSMDLWKRLAFKKR